jgi:hypothetical protein
MMRGPSRSSCVRFVFVAVCFSGMQDGGDDPFFDRELEREKLLEYLGSKPRGVLLVLGPRNSGKTRLLKQCSTGARRGDCLPSTLMLGIVPSRALPT